MRARTRRVIFAGAALTLAAGSLALVSHLRRARHADAQSGETASAAQENADEPTFVGSDACASCHPQEHAAFVGSHHDRATAEPTPRSLLAPFEGETYRAGRSRRPTTLRFSRVGRRYVVDSSRPGGRPQRYDVAFTFGVASVQQILVAGERGRVHAMPIAWDARPGGRGWFALPGGEASLTSRAVAAMPTWNTACADCHSTFVERHYDTERDAFATEFAELDVGCEACHGPASRHIAWTERHGADVGIVNRLRGDHAWLLDPITGSARAHPMRADAEIETCAPCHAARDRIAPSHRAGSAFLDGFRPALLTAPGYEEDGRMREEVYEWGSFVQSRMYATGVACSDCHEPHSGSLRAAGDALCARCHSESRFDTRNHRALSRGSHETSCVGCHMPSRTFLGIDVRHDHSFGGFRTMLADVPPKTLKMRVLDRTLPAMVRATLLVRLARTPGEELRDAVAGAARDASDLVRMASARASAALPVATRLPLVFPLLGDARLAVRLEAARVLLDVPFESLDTPHRRTLDTAFEELLESELIASDDPEAWERVATIELARGHVEASEEAMRVGGSRKSP